MINSRVERIEQRKKEIGSKHDRKLLKYSSNFNEIFNFFLMSYRKGLLTFCGSNVDAKFNVTSIEAKNAFRKFDNGDYQNGKIIETRQPNILKAVIIGKKSWGLFLNEWSDGIVEGSFRINEIIDEFRQYNINIPQSLMTDFENRIYQKRVKKFL